MSLPWKLTERYLIRAWDACPDRLYWTTFFPPDGGYRSRENLEWAVQVASSVTPEDARFPLIWLSKRCPAPTPDNPDRTVHDNYIEFNRSRGWGRPSTTEQIEFLIEQLAVPDLDAGYANLFLKEAV